MVGFKIDEKTITIEEFNQFEALLEGLKFPDDYKSHMLTYNGGSVPFDYDYLLSYLDDNNELIEAKFIRFYSLERIKLTYEKKHEFLFPKLLAIGLIEGGYLAMGYTKNNYGEIFVFFSSEGPYKVANSFKEFIENLEVVVD
ncbi:SMI1_KNR4 domain-containing protein [Tenacibaculum sp. 190524A05c]|uniref:SMI1/KNR4 family protein n=1 Tax=Tenacibaculum platacis TaxID=3137852 RepID=UPI0031FB0333